MNWRKAVDSVEFPVFLVVVVVLINLQRVLELPLIDFEGFDPMVES